MKLHIISAALPPRLDGIGDYTAQMAAALAPAADVTVLTGIPGPDPIPGVRVLAAFDAGDPRSVWKLQARVAADPPDWVLLQYNPFCYGRWGLNLHLPRVLARLRRTLPATRLAVMVHEPFVPLSSLPFAAMSLWQRPQLWSLGRAADQLFFSIDPWAKRFARWFPRTPVQHLPVGSNIPRVPLSRSEARARLGLPADAVVLGLFGTLHVSRMLDRVRGALAALDAAGIPARLLYVGPDGDALAAALAGWGLDADTLLAGGPFPAAEVSRRLAAMDIYLAAYSDGVSTRRGAFLAALQHGLAAVGTRGPLTDALLEREAGHAFLLADAADPAAFTEAVLRLAEDAAARERLGHAAAQLYAQEFTWEIIALKLLQALQQSCFTLCSWKQKPSKAKSL